MGQLEEITKYEEKPGIRSKRMTGLFSAVYRPEILRFFTLLLSVNKELFANHI